MKAWYIYIYIYIPYSSYHSTMMHIMWARPSKVTVNVNSNCEWYLCEPIPYRYANMFMHVQIVHASFIGVSAKIIKIIVYFKIASMPDKNNIYLISHEDNFTCINVMLRINRLKSILIIHNDISCRRSVKILNVDFRSFWFGF